MTTLKDIKERFDHHVPIGECWAKHFAVVLPLVDLDDGAGPRILYEVRAQKLDRQPGEVCFPGGQIEEGETPLEAAIRETEEELGICRGAVEIITELVTICTRAGSQIHCFIGIIDKDDFKSMTVSRAEVDEIFTVPVEDLMNTECEVYWNVLRELPTKNFPYDRVNSGEAYKWKDGKAPVPVFDVNERIIWGLTGRMTREFIEVMRRS